MHPTQSLTLVHDRHRSLRATAPTARPDRVERTNGAARVLIGAIRAAFASVRGTAADRRPVRPLATRPSDC